MRFLVSCYMSEELLAALLFGRCFDALLHQTIRNHFQRSIISVRLLPHPLNGFLVSVDVEHFIQPKNIVSIASTPCADGTELQGIIGVLAVGLPLRDVAP